MSKTQTLETKTLVEAMESRANEYHSLRSQFETLKTAFQDIVNLDDFKGRTADSVKGFYRAQIDVVDTWLDFIDLQEAFFKGIKGIASDEGLDEGTVVHIPFLDTDLKNSETQARQMVDAQEQALRNIFSDIKDIISLEPYSTRRFDKYIDQATEKRKETKEKVENFDQTLVEHYNQSIYHENIIAGLISELYKASSQGGEVNPLHFNENAYKNSEIHTAKEEAKQITAEYISWQDSLEKARELENRPWYEKTWDTVCTFTGEVTGYYDMKRATTGIDPVTGEELTAGQRTTAAALAAAGFIPFVGWAGRAAKGGNAIYKTSKTFKAADSALDAYRTTEAFDILRKTEYGLYGLASANGFSEYITGKDMFGNELTEQQRKDSLTQSILLLGVGGGSIAIDRVQAMSHANYIFPTPNPPATKPGIQKPWNLQGAIQFVKDITPRVHVVQDSLGQSHVIFMKGNGGGGGDSLRKVIPKKQETVKPLENVGGSGHKVKEVKEVDFGKHIIKGENGKKQLLPNSKYVTSDNYKYTTDELGRIVDVDAPELVLQKANRNKYAQSTVGGKDRLPDDDGGHLIGAQFNGPPDIDNLVPQNSQINRRGGVWYDMETEWAKALKEVPPKKVSVNIKPIYSNSSMRPDSFKISYRIEGKRQVRLVIQNKSGG